MMSATILTRQAVATCGVRTLLRSPGGLAVRTASSLLSSSPPSGTFARTPSSLPSHAWSTELSYVSPESDFTSQQVRLSSGSPPAAAEWSHTLSFAGPESDFTSSTSSSSPFPGSDAQTRQTQSSYTFPLWSGMLSFASPESDFVAQGLFSRSAWKVGSSDGLPRTLREVLALEDEAAQMNARDRSTAKVPAIVVTTAEAPHRIVHVNRAWEELCGFGRDEVVRDNKTLSILQGPKTNADLARSTVSRLVKTHQAVDMYQVNYTKSGREFVNHVTMGPMTLSEDSPDVEFLVAVLEQVEPDRVPLRLVSY